VGSLIPGGKDHPAGGVILGLLMASFSAMQFVFAPLWGRTSDRVGRRPVLLLGLASSVVFYALFGVAAAWVQPAGLVLALLFVSRLGAGVAGATIAAAQAVIADCTPPEKRKHGMALIGVAYGIGFTFGPPVGFLSCKLFPHHLGGLGFVAAGLSLAALLLCYRLFPETRRSGGPSATRRLFDWRGFRNVLAMPTVAVLVLTFFLATFGFGQFEATLALFNRDTLHLAEDDSFWVFAYVGAVLMVVQAFLYRRLARRLSEETFMSAGIVLMGLGLVGLGGGTWLAEREGVARFGVLLAVTAVSLTVAVTGFGFVTPSVQALISRRSDPARQGEVLGVNQSAASLARIFGPFIGLTLYKLDASHLLPYGFGAILLLFMLPLIPRIRRGPAPLT
jgi:MFS family permease